MHSQADDVYESLGKLSASGYEFLRHDDIDLPAGKLRVRKGGSAGTHNGMKSLIANVGSDFVRVRIGIGRPPAGGDLIRYVIGKLGRAQMAELTSSAQTAARAAMKIVSEGVAAAQQEFN